jgi:glycosyltransferase involved in cell wall biosynthesis
MRSHKGLIALVAPRYAPAIGGLERHVEVLARGLVARGFGVEVITTDPSGRLEREQELDGVLVRRFRTLANDGIYFVAPGLGRWLRRNSGRFDLLHAHSYHTPLALQAALNCRRSGTPLLLTPHYHGTGHSPLRRALHLPYRAAGGWALRQARRVLCVSQTERALIERHFGANLACVVAPNGVQLGELLAAEQHPTPEGRVQLLAVGRLESYKQTDRLARALAHLPADYQATVIGDGPLRPRLARLRERLYLYDRLRLLSHVPHSELLARYRSADVFVSLSRHEAFGLTLLEAAVAGAAVVASDIPAHREVAGYLPADRVTFVRPGCSAAELARALQRATVAGRAADTWRWQLPSWEGMVERVAACYWEVLDEGPTVGEGSREGFALP